MAVKTHLLELSDAGFGGEDGLRNASILTAACQTLTGRRGAILRFPPGRHVVEVSGARALFAAALDADISPPDRPVPVPFPAIELRQAADIEIDGGGCTLVVVGLSSPITIDDCAGVRIHDMAIDLERQPITSGPILECYEGGCLIAAGDDLPPRSRVFFSYLWDPDTGQFTNYWAGNGGRSAELTPSGLRIPLQPLSLNGPAMVTPAVGQVLVVQHDLYASGLAAGIHLRNSIDVLLEDITLHACIFFGIMARTCHDLTLRRVHALPSSGRLMSVQRDFLHAFGCTGLVTMEGCRVQSIGDDGFNIDIKLLKIRRMLGTDTLEVTPFVPFGSVDGLPEELWPGGVLRVRRVESLHPMASLRICNVERSPEDPIALIVRFMQPLPDDLSIDDVLEAADRIPQARIIDCHFSDLFAHGGRLQCHGAEIAHCSFTRCFGAAVDLNPTYGGGWAEGMPCQNVQIHHNRIRDCGRAFLNNEGCGIVVRCENRPLATANSHRHLKITDNDIDGPAGTAAISVSCATDVLVARNLAGACQNLLSDARVEGLVSGE